MWTQETVDRWYSSGDYMKAIAGGPTPERMQALAKLRLRFLQQHGINKVCRFLELGSGAGYLLRLVGGKFGAETVGLEKDPRRAELSNASNPTGEFDLIAAVHSLEHMPRPLEMLKYLVGMLTLDGHVLIEVPSEYWWCESHLVMFTPRALATVTGLVGLSMITGGNVHSDGRSYRALFGRTRAESQGP
jgi:SAM-dependent methyltransferase